MVKTKYFTSRWQGGIDKKINEFLELNPGIEVVDIKLNSIGFTQFCPDGYASALLIYKENK
ncbi:MAG: sporulation protein Cse60 [Bacilli bacterium]|nr:sporulation protein Cse60 [Bacilli bacterium]